MLTVGSSGIPTPERKPTPVRASAFQGCSNYFEPLKRHLAEDWVKRHLSGLEVDEDVFVTSPDDFY